MKNHTGKGSYPNGLQYTADNGLVNTRISMGKAKFSTYQVDAGSLEQTVPVQNVSTTNVKQTMALSGKESRLRLEAR